MSEDYARSELATSRVKKEYPRLITSVVAKPGDLPMTPRMRAVIYGAVPLFGENSAAAVFKDREDLKKLILANAEGTVERVNDISEILSLSDGENLLVLDTINRRM